MPTPESADFGEETVFLTVLAQTADRVKLGIRAKVIDNFSVYDSESFVGVVCLILSLLRKDLPVSNHLSTFGTPHEAYTCLSRPLTLATRLRLGISEESAYVLVCSNETAVAPLLEVHNRSSSASLPFKCLLPFICTHCIVESVLDHE